jgi:transcriptional regulator with XRE-family HTH domain
MVARRVGANLRRARKRADLSQEELAVRASLHRTAVGQLERGERVARADTLVKLAGSLGIRPGELLDGLQWEPGGTRVGRLSDGGVG